MQLIHVLALVLATIRLTELLTQDRITDWMRQLFPIFFLTCGRCVSVWAGIACTYVYVRAPILNWPLASSCVFLLYAHAISRWTRSVPPSPATPGPRQIVIGVDPAGNVSLNQSGFGPAEVQSILSRMALAIGEQKP